LSTSRFIQATTGINAGCVFALGQRSVMGRSPSCQIQVMDPQVSRVHAALELDDDGHTVLRDLSSANGTFIRQNRVETHRLRSGDTFRIGSSEFVFGEVRGDVVDSESLRRAFKVVSVRAMRATTIVSEALETMRKKLADSSEGDDPGETAESCGDALHETARARGWLHCPACGGRIRR
jgi:predicted component of type VI protein secretion system